MRFIVLSSLSFLLFFSAAGEASETSASLCRNLDPLSREYQRCNRCWNLGYVFSEAECVTTQNNYIRCPMYVSNVWCQNANQCAHTQVLGRDYTDTDGHNNGNACIESNADGYKMQSYCASNKGNFCSFRDPDCNSGWQEGEYNPDLSQGTTELCCNEGWDYDIETGFCKLHKCPGMDVLRAHSETKWSSDLFAKYYPYDKEHGDNLRSSIGAIESCQSGNEIRYRYTQCGLCDDSGNCGEDDTIEQVWGPSDWGIDCHCKDRENYPYSFINGDFNIQFGYAGGAKGLSASCTDNDDLYIKYINCKRGFMLDEYGRCGTANQYTYYPYKIGSFNVSLGYQGLQRKQHFDDESFESMSNPNTLVDVTNLALLPSIPLNEIFEKAAEAKCEPNWSSVIDAEGNCDHTSNPRATGVCKNYKKTLAPLGENSYTKVPDCLISGGSGWSGAEIYLFSVGNGSFTGTGGQYDLYAGYKKCPSDADVNTPYHVRGDYKLSDGQWATQHADGAADVQSNGLGWGAARAVSGFACYGVCSTGNLNACRAKNILRDSSSGKKIGLVYYRTADEMRIFSLDNATTGEKNEKDAWADGVLKNDAKRFACGYAPKGFESHATYGVGHWDLPDAALNGTYYYEYVNRQQLVQILSAFSIQNRTGNSENLPNIFVQNYWVEVKKNTSDLNRQKDGNTYKTGEIYQRTYSTVGTSSSDARNAVYPELVLRKESGVWKVQSTTCQ